MAEFTNTSESTRTWGDYCRGDGRTLQLTPGESADVFRRVVQDGVAVLEPVEGLNDPCLRPASARKLARKASASTPTVAAPVPSSPPSGAIPEPTVAATPAQSPKE